MKRSHKFWLIVGAIVLIAADYLVSFIKPQSPLPIRVLGCIIILSNIWYIVLLGVIFIPKFNNWLNNNGL